MMKIFLQINSEDQSFVNKKFKVYAEVHGETEAIAWVGGMSFVQSKAGKLVLPLELSLRWLTAGKDRMSAAVPVVLKNAYVQDVDTSVVLCHVDEIKLTQAALVTAANDIRVLEAFTGNQLIRKLSTQYRFEG